jgi:signal transduction histidine kinase
LTATADSKRILFISPRREAGVLIDQLRAAGHEASIVEDFDDGYALLSSGGFDQTVIAARAAEELLSERALWRASDTDSWRRSTAAIAHDLRNFLEMLERSIGEARLSRETYPQESRRTIGILCGFLLELVEDLQASCRPGLVLSVVDLEDAVEVAAVTVYPSAVDRRQRLIVDIKESARYVRADATKAKRVLANLLALASRQSPARGTVVVSARRDSGDCVIGVTYTAETLTLAGLSELFKPAVNGAPLVGLRSIQDIVDQHGGRLWVESQRGAETSVYISLPSPEILDAQPRPSPAPASSRNIRFA